jgi:hypothetical protein
MDFRLAEIQDLAETLLLFMLSTRNAMRIIEMELGSILTINIV